MDSNFKPQPSVEGLSKELLLINPFPGILSADEFREAVRSGRTFFERYLTELDDKAQVHSHNDNSWGLLETRMVQDDFYKDFVGGKITEDFNDTIFLEDPIMASTASKKITAMQGTFRGLSVLESDYGEAINQQDLFDLYAEDPSGKFIVTSIATEKVWHAYNKIEKGNTKDLIGTDVGVFVPDKKVKPVYSPEQNGGRIKPTHRWLRKPSNAKEMEGMLKCISGKAITIVTSIVIKYQILKDGPITYRHKELEFDVPIRQLSEEEINSFVRNHFTQGRNIAGGVDYTSYGSEIIKDGIPLDYNLVITPTAEIKKLWAQVQVIKRAAQLKSKELATK